MSEDKQSHVNRRDFMKMVATGFGVAAAPRWIRRLGENQDGPELVLGDKEPTFRIGWHALLDKDVQPGRAVMGGELDYRSLEIFLGVKMSEYPVEADYTKRSSDMSFLQPGTKSGAEHTRVHKRALEAAKKQGTQIIACDNTFWESVGVDRIMDSLKTGNERFVALTLTALGGGLFKAGKMLTDIKSGKGLQINDDFWDKLDSTTDRLKEIEKQYPNTSFALKSGLLYWVGSKFGNLDKTGEDGASMLLESQKLLVGIQDNELAELNDLIEIRNLSMSLNYRAGLSMLDQLPVAKHNLLSSFNHQEIELFYFAGSGHIGSKVAYQEGADKSRTRLNGIQEKTISKFKKRIKNALGDDKKLDEQIKFFVLNSSSFSFPIASFMASDEYGETPLRVMYSPRANFWQLLLKEQQKEPSGEEMTIMIESMIDEDNAFFNKLNRSVPQIRQKAQEKDMCQNVVDFKIRNKDYQLRIVDGIPVVDKKETFEI